MLKLAPLLLAIAYGFVMYRFSVMRTRKALDAQSTALADAGLERAFAPLAQALDVIRIPVNIYEIEPVNGLAAPDGRIFITRGFYKKYLAGEVDADELAAVIAHELGHVALGHSRRRMIDFSGQNAIRVGLMMVIGRMVPWIGPLLVNGLMRLISARLSRGDEYEADAYASALLIKAGIGTAPQKSLFRKLEGLTGATGAAPAWLLSHPKTGERIAAITANERKWGV
ncbi:Metalloprotease LoiP precursor [Aquimixticola soesokkakensis]|uniref:Metalloprotease LoiP n=1 Tax=Aquimixticola soesokkakensis TaxID=1519096 RepID=A0A1Y5SMF0_9RHOB|nr:M48 family metallopeptidase [Aquimixticola soesokkakensis]SLN44133.1 Metalloprotease LoiP precursor [Aquimixticola soesokkakensis]